MNDTTGNNTASGNGNPGAAQQTAAAAFKHHLKRCAAMTSGTAIEYQSRVSTRRPSTVRRSG